MEGAVVLDNKNGTAPGLWLESGTKTFILLPGPPAELKPMLVKAVLPRLKTIQKKFCFRCILKITGLTESMTESQISDLYPAQEDHDLNLTILASPGQIEIHMSGYSDKSKHQARNKVKHLEKSIRERLQDKIFSDGKELEEVIGDLLMQNQATLAVAESCTGGLLGHRITNVPGSSKYFLQGVQVYSYDAKIRLLGIPKQILDTHGAVSAETSSRMALKIRKISQADYGLAITGIAGPGGGTAKKPVGLVYTSLASKLGVITKKNIFLGNREIIKYRASQKALDMLRRHLQNPTAYSFKRK
jgi:nicotinamide-nucleotide amidase